MGMTIALLPITGVPLPLISYSGSFVLMIMFGLGLVNSVWIHRKIPE
jgi:rod shape determining protein RodA